jgi:quercetin dioxygenase-like cupin family protein
MCQPISQRTQEVGCWILTNQNLGVLPAEPMFWHLDTYPTRTAAEGAKSPRSTVIEAFSRIWLFTIERSSWRPASGNRIAAIGPLPIKAAAGYTAQYLEAVFTPGMTTVAHRHAGPEAWYAISGETCLETSEGRSVGRPGGPPIIVREGLPMRLTAIGAETRRSLVLILHDSNHPSMTPAPDWTPKNLCR